MPLSISLIPSNFKPLDEISFLFTDENNYNVDENLIGIKRKQIVPSIYLSTECIKEIKGGVKGLKSKFTDASEIIQDSVAIPGILLRIFSNQKTIRFAYEEITNPYERFYTPQKSNFYFFLNINRSEILNYRKLDNCKFLGVNAKKSIEMSLNTGMGAVRGGLIGFALHRGITKLISGAEDDIVLLEGHKFELNYKNNKITVLVENAYIEHIENFLKKNWTSIEPEKKTEQKNKGCFIATATMGSYYHPVVIELRDFRDNWLLKRQWGIKFTNWYYIYGFKAAKLIDKSFILKKMSYYLIVKPLHLITRLFR